MVVARSLQALFSGTVLICLLEAGAPKSPQMTETRFGASAYVGHAVTSLAEH